MKVTFILKNLSDAFYNGNGGSIPSFNAQSNEEKFERLISQTCRDLGVTCKVGNGSFRDRVDFNSALKNGAKPISFTLEPRRGYKFATFIY